MAEEWAGVIHTTSVRELKDAEDHTIRGYYMLSKMKKAGRITYDNEGRSVQWQVDLFEHEPTAIGDNPAINYDRLDKYRRPSVDWRGYEVNDMMGEKEKLMNRSPEALINRYSEIVPGMRRSLTNKFGRDELWVDGYAANNGDRLHGIESFMTETTPGAADLIATPNDSYGGLLTNLADEGGTWSADLGTSPNATLATDWPFGKGTSEYDYWAPKLINWSGTGWTGNTGWEDNCVRVINHAVTWARMTSGVNGVPEALCMSGNLYTGLRNYHESQLRIIVPNTEADDLGFQGQTINQEGVACMADFGVPTDTGYLINFNEMSMECMYSQMFMPKGPEWSMEKAAYLFLMMFFGNIRWNPKGFSKLKNYA
jgi:hypothetical protein